MITIIEGADGTGKTTLAKSIADATGAEYWHAGPPMRGSWWAEYVEPCLTAQLSGTDLVLDRWHTGEMVWPSLFGRASLFGSIAEYQDCCDQLGQAGARLILVVRDEAAITAELERRGEHDQIGTVLRSQRRFLAAFDAATGLPKQIADSDSVRSLPCMF